MLVWGERRGVLVLWLIWIGVALLLGILEFVTVDLFFLTLAAAAVLAGVTGAFGLGFVAQLIVFIASSLVLLVLVRPWAQRLLRRSTPDIVTNAQAYAGKKAVVLAPLVGEDGRVRIGGEVWSARGQDGLKFPVGADVRVIAIEGATAVVGPLDEYVPTPPSSVPPNPGSAYLEEHGYVPPDARTEDWRTEDR